MKIVKWFTVLSAGVLLSTVAESASAQPPGPPFQQSDIVQWQVPGEGTKTYFFPEGGPQSFQYNFLGPNVVQAGLTDTIFQFTQPVADPDPITDPANPNVSDILAVKVIGNTYNLSFWSQLSSSCHCADSRDRWAPEPPSSVPQPEPALRRIRS
jgi:hypothetical protein